MVKVLSLDLRERVVAAIDGGMSRRQAAERFGVGIATAVRWAQLAREKGSPAAMKVGGDRRSERIERHAGFILDLVLQLPNIEGRSRHGLPLRTIQSTASRNSRLSRPLRPGLG